MQKTWVDNAFWTDGTTETKDTVTGILEIQDGEDGPVTRQVLTVNKLNPDETPNPDWDNLMEQVGADKIEANTKERHARKNAERTQAQQHQQEVAKAKALEELFNYKLKAFEIEDIKNCTDRVLKAKLRKAKNTVEVNVYATMIIMESQKNESTEEESSAE